MTSDISEHDMQRRLVRYDELRPCTTAFIDARSPGSDRKENFTIIGPGVAENPDQHVHIPAPHGFNIGGARQPPGCVNSQHSHETAEVFIIHSGRWRFKTGEWGTDGHVDLSPGDVISIPTRCFRGFENIGQDVGFMFAVLGGDDPGRVTWAPHVFEAAREHGLMLLESGRLIDTRREQLAPDAHVMQPPTPAEVANLTKYDSAEIARCTARFSDLPAGVGGLSTLSGFTEYAVAGVANPAEPMPPGHMGWPHGFQLRTVTVAAGSRSPFHTRSEAEVLLMHEGQLEVAWPSGSLNLRAGDVLSMPAGLPRSFCNGGPGLTTAHVVRGGDFPAGLQLQP
jgi:quercetin dioxygenase-like cupin family protein